VRHQGDRHGYTKWLTAVSKCQCEIIRNTQGVYPKDCSSNRTKPLKISPEERISAEEIMKHPARVTGHMAGQCPDGHPAQGQEEFDVEVILTRGSGWGSSKYEGTLKKTKEE
jgi:hypothetical protein